jgi:chemotaxis protein MotA
MKFSPITLLAYVLSLSVLLIGSLDTVGAVKFTESLPEFLKIPFLDFASMFVVLGGVMTGLFIMYPTGTVLNAVATLRHVFSHYSSKGDLVEKHIERMLQYRTEYSQDKNGFVERIKSKTSDPTTRFMFDLVSTNYSSRELRDMADMYLDKRLTQEIQKADVLSMMSATSPAFGMVGTILGLIVMLGNLDDPSAVGPGLSLALLTTLYGVAFANLVFAPMAKKIRYNMGIVETRESITIEGIILIKEGKSEMMIKDQLFSLLGKGSGE